MKKKSVLLIWLIISFVTVYSQQRILTIDEAAIEQYRKFYPQYLQQLQWRSNSETFTFNKNGNLYEGNLKDSSKTEILNSSEILKAFKVHNLNSPSPYSSFLWVNKNLLKIETTENIILFNVNSKKIEQYVTIDSLTENIDFCNKSKLLAYTKLNNLYVSDMQSKETAISDEKNTGIIFGKSVHREEFGIVKGTFWSSSGKKLAFYRMDETMVTQYPLVNIEPRIAELKNIRYPMAGMQSHIVTVGVYSVESGKTIYLKTGEPNVQYLTNISWSNDDKY
ncbi:MAG: S9 family peptidase, partial [Bacteroidetes bacterium CG_4_8_14_3_um_filter_31_14]